MSSSSKINREITAFLVSKISIVFLYFSTANFCSKKRIFIVESVLLKDNLNGLSASIFTKERDESLLEKSKSFTEIIRFNMSFAGFLRNFPFS